MTLIQKDLPHLRIDRKEMSFGVEQGSGNCMKQ